MKRLLRTTALGAALAIASCAETPKPTNTATAEAQANAQPKPGPAATPGPNAGQAATAPAKEIDPWAGKTDLYVAPTVTPSTKVDLGTVDRFTLPSGLKVIVVPRKQVPVVDVTVAVEAGDAEVPLDKSGLASYTAAMLRKGTKKRSADQIAQAIDFAGGSLGADSDEEASFVSCHARTKDLALCLDLVSDVIVNPTFPEKEMGEIKQQLEATVEQAKDSAEQLANLHAANLFYGDDDPRGRPVSKRSIAAIDRSAIVDFHKKWYAPNNAILVVAGDVDAKVIKGQLGKAFSSWKKHEVPKRAAHALPKPPPGMAVRFVDKPDATQAAMVIVGPGIAHGDKDFFAVRLMNYSLGGGAFSSRLMKVVRSEGGKTYGATSRFDTRRDPGDFSAATYTRSSEAASTLKLVLGEIDRMRNGGPNADELAAAKGNLVGGYGLHLETGADVARALLVADLDDLDKDFVEKYAERLNAVSLDDAKKAAAAHLSPTALVVVGKAEEVKPLLEKAGYSLTDTVAYTDPISPAERKAIADEKKAGGQITPAQAELGKKLLAEALKAKGGVAAMQKIKELKLSGKGTMSMGPQSVPVTLTIYEVPAKAERVDLSLMGGVMTVKQVVSDGKGFIVQKSPQGEKTQDAPAEMAQNMMKHMRTNTAFVLLEASQPGVKVRGINGVTDDGASFDELDVVWPDGESVRLLLDPKTHLIARQIATEDGAEARELLSDYKAVSGVQFPGKTVQSSNGQKMEMSIESVEVNPGFPKDLFSK